MSGLISGLPPEEPDLSTLPWWEVVLGAVGVAVITLGLIWGFGLLEAVLGVA